MPVGVELLDAEGGSWAHGTLTLEPSWISAAVSWRQVLVLYSIQLGVRPPPNTRRYGPTERRNELRHARQAGIVAAGLVQWTGRSIGSSPVEPPMTA